MSVVVATGFPSHNPSLLSGYSNFRVSCYGSRLSMQPSWAQYFARYSALSHWPSWILQNDGEGGGRQLSVVRKAKCYSGFRVGVGRFERAGLQACRNRKERNRLQPLRESSPSGPKGGALCARYDDTGESRALSKPDYRNSETALLANY